MKRQFSSSPSTGHGDLAELFLKDDATVSYLNSVYMFNYPLFFIKSAVIIALLFSVGIVLHSSMS
jgi:hypothetical protein